MLKFFTPILFLLSFFSCGNDSPAEQRVAEASVAVPAATPEQQFTSHDGQTIAYADEGTGQPVLLLHGFINAGSSWSKTVLKQQLLLAGFRVIVPDLRGNGRSAKPQNPEAYANDAEAKDLIALADHLQLSAFTAVGYSRGAIVLAKLLTLDDRVKRAVLGGMGIDFTDPEWPRRKMFAAAFNGQPTSETQGAVDYANSVKADLRSLYLQQEYQPVTSPDALRSVNIPVLIIAGKEDKDNGDAGKLERLFPNGKLAIVPGNHNDTYKSMVFAAAVMAFVKAG